MKPERPRRKWYHDVTVRGLVAIYYVVLRTVLRKKPELRRYLVRCRHCWIFFLTDPRNAGREDLACPFGCAALHRRRESDKRSAAANATPIGKDKRKLRGLSAVPEVGGEPSAGASTDGAEARSAGQVPGDPEIDPTPPSAEPIPPPSGRPQEGTDAPHPQGEEKARDPPGGACPEAAGLEALEHHPIVGYVRRVTSLIEGRRVSLLEVLEMLERASRQHSFARERRMDYVLRWLNEHLANPP